jgi:hypothetical protein
LLRDSVKNRSKGSKKTARGWKISKLTHTATQVKHNNLSSSIETKLMEMMIYMKVVMLKLAIRISRQSLLFTKLVRHFLASTMKTKLKTSSKRWRPPSLKESLTGKSNITPGSRH